MCGGKITPGTLVSEQYLLDLEREAFLSLCGEKKTQERIALHVENREAVAELEGGDEYERRSDCERGANRGRQGAQGNAARHASGRPGRSAIQGALERVPGLEKPKSKT